MMNSEVETRIETWLHRAKKNAGWLMALGVLEVLVGLAAIFSPLIAGVAVVITVGVVMLIVGITRIISAFMAGSFGSGVLAFLWGLLVTVAGYYFVTHPALGLKSLTLFVAVALAIDGVMRVIMSFQMKPANGWGWMLFGGIVSVILAVMVFNQFPVSAVWLVGTLVGISVLFNGFTTLTVAMAARRLASAGVERLQG
ncbi:HdeD family acid-resistance protein [Polymorphobacter arshaanensis]|uniref:HdeD family acid-resistance protein n=1 Tax=Glacieibacterium arshaanense TaxID=2511025 RepID=A0A4Y9ERU6_9SPHN|nr:HdeD family acid-resistance protein [Polymorphobacter arshaanensis]TFU05899.1 HdeD family acid-resistance protein [Polymorphobacter arshaanensis]